MNIRIKVQLLIMAVVLCMFYRSLSFILVMGGTAFVLLSFMYFCIDAIKWWNGVPFIYPGEVVYKFST